MSWTFNIKTGIERFIQKSCYSEYLFSKKKGSKCWSDSVIEAEHKLVFWNFEIWIFLNVEVFLLKASISVTFYKLNFNFHVSVKTFTRQQLKLQRLNQWTLNQDIPLDCWFTFIQPNGRKSVFILTTPSALPRWDTRLKRPDPRP